MIDINRARLARLIVAQRRGVPLADAQKTVLEAERRLSPLAPTDAHDALNPAELARKLSDEKKISLEDAQRIVLDMVAAAHSMADAKKGSKARPGAGRPATNSDSPAARATITISLLSGSGVTTAGDLAKALAVRTALDRDVLLALVTDLAPSDAKKPIDLARVTNAVAKLKPGVLFESVAWACASAASAACGAGRK